MMKKPEPEDLPFVRGYISCGVQLFIGIFLCLFAITLSLVVNGLFYLEGRMNRKEKNIVAILAGISIGSCVMPKAHAMHIMEGYLPLKYCVAWGLLCVPFIVAGVFKIKRMAQEHHKVLLIFAMAGAYAFVLSSLKLPSVTGSSSHPTGMGLGAIMFGPASMSVIGMLVLVFQAILLAHGGITTLGANTFSMAIAGPVLSWGIFKLCKACNVNRKASVFLASALGNMFTYCITSVQLGIAHSSVSGGVRAAIIEFLGVFAFTQIPLAIMEGVLTVVVFIGLETYARPELKEVGFVQETLA